MKRSLLLGIALVSAIIFFSHVETLWPIGHQRVLRDAASLEQDVLATLQQQGIDISDYQRASRLRVDDDALHYVEFACGKEQAETFIKNGLPLFYYRLSYKKPKSPIKITCAVHPDGQVLGWDEEWPRDHAAGEQNQAEALLQAHACLREVFQFNDYIVVEKLSRSFPHRQEHRFVFSITHQETPRIEEEISIFVSGNHIRRAWRELIVPAASKRELHAQSAPQNLLQNIGFAIFGIAAVFAVIKILLLMNSGHALKIIPCLWVASIISVLLLINTTLQGAYLFEVWDPLWPAFISYADSLLFFVMNDITTLIPLFAFLIIAQHIDDSSGNKRMSSLWQCLKGNLGDIHVRNSSINGFAIGFIAGATLVMMVLLCQWLFSSSTALQPRGFFYYTINSSASILTCLCFFGYIAFLEEGAYRLFGGSYLEQRFQSRAIAIIIPAIVYGLTHAEFAFLPPADPWWARAVCLTAVGCVWGWAFFKFDALTVILSHFAADLFIFNWPLIASGETWPCAMAIISISLPLWPFIIGTTLSNIKNESQPKAEDASA